MPIAKAALLALLGPAKDQEEQTTTGNVGAFPVPMAPEPLRRVFPGVAGKRKKRRRVPIPVTGMGSIEVHDIPMEALVRRAERLLEDLRS